MDTALTWQSYETALFKVLDLLRPKTCFEWGCGESTKMISNYSSIELMDSVEHDAVWLDKISKVVNDKVMMIYEPDREKYKFVQGRKSKYDLIFIDGRDRENCLIQAHYILDISGVVILHDSEREKYLKSIQSYKYQIWMDNKHTVLLTNDDIVGSILHENCYSST